MSLRAILAGNLKRLRKEQGISQEELADRASVDRTYVSALERQIYSASLDTLERMAAALNVQAYVLIVDPTEITDPRAA